MVTQSIDAFIASEYMEVWSLLSKHKHCPIEREQHSVVHKSYMSVVMTRSMYSSSGKCNRISGTPKYPHNYIVTVTTESRPVQYDPDECSELVKSE
jgi:hypothetical protein